MKTHFLVVLFSHPLAQLVSFCCILVSGQDFGAPYGWIVKYALSDGKAFAIAGAVAMLLTFLSLFTDRYYLQLGGILLMWVSIVLFLSQLVPGVRGNLFHGTLPLLSHLLFLVVSVLVAFKFWPRVIT